MEKYSARQMKRAEAAFEATGMDRAGVADLVDDFRFVQR
jgi:hypothetical protein